MKIRDPVASGFSWLRRRVSISESIVAQYSYISGPWTEITRSAGRTYVERTRSLREKPSKPRWTGIGFIMGNQQGVYEVELITIMRGIHHLASRYCSWKRSTTLNDSPAAMERIQSDAPGPGNYTAIGIVGSRTRCNYEQGNTLINKWAPATEGARATRKPAHMPETPQDRGSPITTAVWRRKG